MPKPKSRRPRTVKAAQVGVADAAPATQLAVVRSVPNRHSDHDVRDRDVLARIVDTPQLARVIPQLPAELLHRVIQSYGLEACGEIVALATPPQLSRIFDLDLWQRGAAGSDEKFDADRFSAWLEILVECGADVAADKLAALDADLVVAGLSRYVRIFDAAAAAPYTTTDGDTITPRRPDPKDDELVFEVGGYRIEARQEIVSNPWDAIVAALTTLERAHEPAFHRLMRGCRTLSYSAPELDGLDDLLGDADQLMFDVDIAREERRDRQGYVTAAQARAFLRTARQPERRQRDEATDAIVRAYFRGLDGLVESRDGLDQLDRRSFPDATISLDAAGDVPDDVPISASTQSSAQADIESVATVIDLLREAGVVPPSPRAMLGGAPDQPRPNARLDDLMAAAFERSPALYEKHHQTLGFLANVLVAGCSLQNRAFTPKEASDGAIAICNLGLENQASVEGAGRANDDLLYAFEAGWRTLYENVSLGAAKRLIDVIGGLVDLRYADRATPTGLKSLRVALKSHVRAGTPWEARGSLDVLTELDLPAWAVLVGLLDECPVFHPGIAAVPGSGVRSVAAADFAFISTNDQIDAIHAFMRRLPDLLRP